MRFEISPGLATRYGLDRDACLGGPLGPYPWQREEYVVAAPGPEAPEEIRSLHVKRWHNFGNMVFQLTNALRFAQQHGIELVSGPENPWFVSGSTGDVRFRFGRRAVAPRLVGTYFYRQPLGLGPPGLQGEHLRAMRRLFVLDGERAPYDEDLVVQLRSGDVFGDDPHPAYWPPSLDYYVTAISMSGARRVRVVSQDLQAPLLEPLRAWCDARGIHLEMQASDLRQDLLALVTARALCLSQGTLGLAAAWLSSTVRAVYLPHGRHAREMGELGYEVYAADETPADERGSWTASPEQVAGLLTETGTRFRRLF